MDNDKSTTTKGFVQVYKSIDSVPSHLQMRRWRIPSLQMSQT